MLSPASSAQLATLCRKLCIAGSMPFGTRNGLPRPVHFAKTLARQERGKKRMGRWRDPDDASRQPVRAGCVTRSTGGFRGVLFTECESETSRRSLTPRGTPAARRA
jgi:hypothetical protein